MQEQNWMQRTELLIGKNNIQKLQKAKVAIYGIGGVGSYIVEGLARAGIGKFVLIDPDTISITNINRQIHATNSTIGKMKIEVMKDRILDINKKAIVEIYTGKEIKDGEENIIDSTFSYVIDAVDTVTTKIKIIQKSKEQNIPVISCMGTGNKIEPLKLEVTDIYKTSTCPLAKVMRKELKKRNIKELKVVYSKEEPIKPKVQLQNEVNNKIIPATISFVPAVAGMIIASEVTKDIIRGE